MKCWVYEAVSSVCHVVTLEILPLFTVTPCDSEHMHSFASIWCMGACVKWKKGLVLTKWVASLWDDDDDDGGGGSFPPPLHLLLLGSPTAFLWYELNVSRMEMGSPVAGGIPALPYMVAEVRPLSCFHLNLHLWYGGADSASAHR